MMSLILTEKERLKMFAEIDNAILTLEICEAEIRLLQNQLAEAQSYKADAERYRWLAKWVDIGEWFCGYGVIKDGYGITDDFYMDDKKHMDEAIDQAMKEL